MNRQKIDLSEERKIITYMIVSQRFLREISNVIHINHLESSYAKIVARWLLEYWGNYKDCPGKNIKEIYNQKKKAINDEDDVELIKEFLSRLSKDYEEIETIQNIEYLIANAIKYLKLQSLKYLKDKIEDSILSAEPLSGEQAVSSYSRIEKPAGEGISLLRDAIKISQSFMDSDEILFRFPGTLGKIMGNFIRGDLVAFLAASNKGKTWWQFYVAQLASFHGLKAVFFSLEMTQNQIVRRAWQGIVGAVRTAGKIDMPYFEESEEDENKYEVKTRRVKKNSVIVEDISKTQKKLRLHTRGGDVKIIVLPHYSATVNDIQAHLDNLSYYDNYLPDVVVVDYADIVASKLKGEYRHTLDDIWKSLRRIAQERNILVVTASQAGRKALKAKHTSESDISEDIRKYNHVAKMFVLNQTKDEYEKGIMRVKQIKERDGRRSYKEVIVLQSLDIGRPYLDSKLEGEVL